MATDTEVLQIAIETVGTKAATTELNRLKKAAKATADETESIAPAAKGAGKGLSKLRGPTSALTTTTGQLSVQVQDVFVQLEGGTDVVRIFAQQMPQIASVFGPTGAVFGAVAAITAMIAGPFVRSLLGSSEALKSSSKFLKEYTDEFDKLTESQRIAKLNEVEQTIKKLDKSIESSSKSIKSLQEDYVRLNSDQSVFIKGIGTQVEITDTAKKSESDLSKEMVAHSAAIDLVTGQLDTQLNMRKLLKGSIDGQTKSTQTQIEKLREEIQTLGMAKNAAILYREAVNGAKADELETLKIQLDIRQAHEDNVEAQKARAKLIRIERS